MYTFLTKSGRTRFFIFSLFSFFCFLMHARDDFGQEGFRSRLWSRRSVLRASKRRSRSSSPRVAQDTSSRVSLRKSKTASHNTTICGCSVARPRRKILTAGLSRGVHTSDASMRASHDAGGRATAGRDRLVSVPWRWFKAGVLSIPELKRERRDRAEINFPGLCKDWRLRRYKGRLCPNGPRVARELHAGNHRERRATIYMWLCLRYHLLACLFAVLFHLNALYYLIRDASLSQTRAS